MERASDSGRGKSPDFGVCLQIIILTFLYFPMKQRDWRGPVWTGFSEGSTWA